MHGQPLVGWLLAAVCASAAAVCLLRMRGAAPAQRSTSAVEALMGGAMAAMALPLDTSALLPPAARAGAFAALFAATALRCLVLLLRRAPHQLHHLVEALAMVHMSLAMAAASGGQHAGHAPSPNAAASLATGALLLYFGLYALRAGAALVPAAAPAGHGVLRPAGGTSCGPSSDGSARGPLAPPEVATACRLTLALGMFAMLAGA